MASSSNTESSPRKRARHEGETDQLPPPFTKPQSIVTIHVGDPTGSLEQRQTYLIYKERLCFYSPVFSAAFNGKFLEGHTQTMDLQDVDCAAFGLLVHWIYTEEVAYDKSHPLRILANLWMLGERFLIPLLQTAALSKIGAESLRQVDHAILDLIHYVYEIEEENLEELKESLIAIVIHRDLDGFEDWMENIPTMMVEGVAEALGDKWEDEKELREESYEDQAMALADEILDSMDGEGDEDAMEFAMERAYETLRRNVDDPSAFSYDSKLEIAQNVLAVTEQ